MQAAANPADGDWFFYVTVNLRTGETKFAETSRSSTGTSRPSSRSTADPVEGVLTGRTRRCGVLGDPIAHSLSPVLHRAGYAALGLDWEYDAHRVAAGGLADFLAGLDDALAGPVADHAAEARGDDAGSTRSPTGPCWPAPPTPWCSTAGGVRGDNTDIPGAVAAIRERYAGPLRPDRDPGRRSHGRLGGAGRSPSWAAATSPCWCGTRPARSETLAAADRYPATLDGDAWAPWTSPLEADLLVSTIPAAAQGADLVARCAAVPAVFEVVYDPWPTPLAAPRPATGSLVGRARPPGAPGRAPVRAVHRTPCAAGGHARCWRGCPGGEDLTVDWSASPRRGRRLRPLLAGVGCDSPCPG